MHDFSKPKNIITITNLTKKFGNREILSDINLDIQKADSIAFTGRNGCGKSTLLKIIAGLMPFEKGEVIHKQSGYAARFVQSIFQGHKKLKFGYVPERFPAMSLTAKDYINHIGAISGLKKDEINTQSRRLFEALFMQDMIETPIRFLSKGTIQKLAVVQAFLITPDVLLLDEPISGQDKDSQQAFMDMVNKLNREQGVTILCSCHEDYMVNAIAKKVYTITDRKLCEAEPAKEVSNENLA